MGARIVKRVWASPRRSVSVHWIWRTARGAAGIRYGAKSGPGLLDQFRHPCFHVPDRPINVAILADNQGIRRQRHRKLADAIEELTNPVGIVRRVSGLQ